MTDETSATDVRGKPTATADQLCLHFTLLIFRIAVHRRDYLSPPHPFTSPPLSDDGSVQTAVG